MNALLESTTGLRFANPGWLLLALALPLALLVRRRRGEPSIRFAPGALLGAAGALGVDATPLPRSWRATLLPLPRALAALGVLCAVFALARPVRREPLPSRAEGIDILLALDTSSSMTSNDMDRSRTRLAVARDAAAEFIRGRRNDRIGLLAFARYPDVRCPLTLDHAALERILDDVATVASDGPEDATGIGTAVARAAQALAGGAARSKVVVLLTDGEENVALKQSPGEIAPAHAAQLCERLGVRVDAIVVGVGRRTATGGWERLDTRAVESLARRTGGGFFEARDAAAVRAVYASIDALEKAPLEEPRTSDEDRFLPFVVAAVTLLLAGRLLGATALGALP